MDKFSTIACTTAALLVFSASLAILSFDKISYSEVEGTIRDKYIAVEEETQNLLVDYSTGGTENWTVKPTVYENCEIGDSISRTSDGEVTCKGHEKE